jgi:hypothetical protein
MGAKETVALVFFSNKMSVESWKSSVENCIAIRLSLFFFSLSSH